MDRVALVIGLIDKTGKRVVSYKYDSWGKNVSITGALAATVGKKNPFRYRGYYFDAESGMYYLQSRYYDPEIRRFINIDEYISDVGEDVRGNNMYTYCFNNPLNMTDIRGNWLTWSQVFTGIAVAAMAVAVTAAVVATAGVAASALATVGGAVICCTATSSAASVSVGALAVSAVATAAAVDETAAKVREVTEKTTSIDYRNARNNSVYIMRDID